MKSPPRCPSLLLLLLLFTLQASAQSPQHTQVSVYPFRESLHMSPNAPKFYRLDLSNMPKELDLSISVLPEARSSAPKLFVSKEKEFLRNTFDAEYSSTTSAENIIFISSQDLQDTSKPLYIGLQCVKARCNANILVEFTKEIKAIANGEKAFESSNSLNGASSAVVRLTVPKEDDIERIVIHVDAITSSRTELPSLDVFINQGTTIPYTNNAENIPRSSWFEGNTMIISKNSNIFCTGCTYTLSLKFKEFSSITVQAQTYKKNTQVFQNTVLDGVQKDAFNAYSFIIRDTHKEEDFVLSVKIQQGKVKVYINCDTQPDSFKNYYWNYLVENSEEIILTKKEHSKCSTENYYFLIYGEESSVYSLRAAYKKSNRLFMGKTTPVTGDIFPQEKITYEVLMPIFAAEEILINLRFKQALDIDIINCRFATDCPGILPADSQYQISNSYGFDKDKDTFDGFSFHKDQFKEATLVKINPHENGCYPILVQDQAYMNEPLPVCAYLVTISSKHSSPVEYTLTADSKGHNWLFINTPKFDSVQRDAVIYYVLYVPHQNVESIQIQLTKFSGDVDIFVSKSNKYPDNKDPTDSQFSHEGFIVIKDLPDMSGAYYIGVYGLETSSFSVSAIVKTKSGMNEDYALTLDQGKPQKGVLLPKHEHPAQFYKFLLAQDNDWKGTLRITVNSLRGRLVVAVNNNGEIPTPNLQQWKSKGHDLEISSDDPNFKKQALYHIGVFVDWTDPDAKYLSDITYNIAFYLRDVTTSVQVIPSVHMFLSPNTPFYGVIHRGAVDYFEAFFLVDDNSVTIYKQADSGDVDLFISIDPKNRFPTADSYTYTTKDQHKNSITLTADDRRKACGTTTSLTCSIYIAVIPSKTQQEETYYSLSIKRETTTTSSSSSSSSQTSTGSAVMALEDGRQIQSIVPANSENPAMFYFYPVPTQHSVVTVTCPGREITISAKRSIINIGSQSKPSVAPLDEKVPEISSLDNQNHPLGVAYVSIPPIFVETGTVVVTLSVYFKDPETAGSQQKPSSQPTFTILASSQITHLFTGYPYFGFVPKEKYQYFYVNVMRSQCTLLITMTTLDDGDPDLLISYGSDSRPTLSDHQFASISKQRTEIIEINNNDIYPRDSMSGYWIIGVYGRTASSFTLTAVYEDQKMVELKPGTPFEMFLKDSSSMYFKFFHEFKSNVNVKLDQFSGNVDLYLTSIDPKDDLASNLPNATSHKWKISGSSAQSSVNIPQQDQKSCFSCLYIINVQTQASSKFSLLVTEGDGIQQIQEGLRYTGSLKPQEKAYYMMTSTNSEEARLNVYMKGIELNVMASQNPTLNTTNYLWREALTPNWPDKSIYLKKLAINDPQYTKPVWDGKRDIPSQRNSFYILLYNPTNFDVEYGFTMTTKESNIILIEGSKQSALIDPYDTVSFLYYSSKAGLQLKLNVEYTVSVPQEEAQYFENTLLQGLKLDARYWSERATAGMGQEVTLTKGPVVDDKSTRRDTGNNKAYTYDLRQTFTLTSLKGKYGFEIENPFRFETEIAIRVYSSETELLTLDQNSQHFGALTPGETEKYEVFMGTAGKWYLWVFACTGNVNLNVEDGDTGEISKTSITIPRGKDHLYKATIPNEGMGNRVKHVSVSAPQEQENTGFFISTSLINEQEFHNYDLRDNHLYMTPSYEYGERSNRVIVRLQPVEFRGGEATDKVRYHVRLCPYNAYRPEEREDFCQLKEECRHYSEEFFMNSQKAVNAKFEAVQDGEYYVQALAVVSHQNQMIKFVPFDVQNLSVVQPIGHKVTGNFWKILGGLVVLAIVIVVCMKAYKKVKEFSEDRGFELEMFSKKKGYDMLGDS